MLTTNLLTKTLLVAGVISVGLTGCGDAKTKKSSVGADAASKVYVEPGKHDEMYGFMSGGFSGQLGVYGIPSGRLLKVIPVFSQNPATKE